MSVERIVMNKRASLTLGDSKMKRHNEVETLKTSSKRDHPSKENTYSYMSTCVFPASQSSIGPRPSRLATADAS